MTELDVTTSSKTNGELQNQHAVPTPNVSVVVPNYNHAAYLRQRLNSILNQTFQNFELILLDDCSTDDSRKILSEYSDHPKVTQVVVNAVNGGSAFAQWERGLSLAEGQYIWIAESDDFCEPDFLQQQVNILNQNPHVVVSYCQSTFVDENGDPFLQDQDYLRWIEPERYEHDFIADGAEEISRFLAFRNTIPNASAVVFRKEHADQITLPVKYRYAGDWLFWIRMLRFGSLAFSAEPLNRFRSHPQTTRAAVSDQARRQSTVEFLSCVQEAGGTIQPQDQPAFRDHRWFLQRWMDSAKTIQWWILKRSEISLSLRLKFLRLTWQYPKGLSVFKWKIVNNFGRCTIALGRWRRRMLGLFSARK